MENLGSVTASDGPARGHPAWGRRLGPCLDSRTSPFDRSLPGASISQTALFCHVFHSPIRQVRLFSTLPAHFAVATPPNQLSILRHTPLHSCNTKHCLKKNSLPVFLEGMHGTSFRALDAASADTFLRQIDCAFSQLVRQPAPFASCAGSYRLTCKSSRPPPSPAVLAPATPCASALQTKKDQRPAERVTGQAA